jgi:hypothetical protein
MPCRRHSELLSRQLDEPLTPGTAFGLRVHLVYCAGCRRLRAQLVRLRELASVIDAGAPDRMPESVRRRVASSVGADSEKN